MLNLSAVAPVVDVDAIMPVCSAWRPKYQRVRRLIRLAVYRGNRSYGVLCGPIREAESSTHSCISAAQQSQLPIQQQNQQKEQQQLLFLSLHTCSRHCLHHLGGAASCLALVTTW